MYIHELQDKGHPITADYIGMMNLNPKEIETPPSEIQQTEAYRKYTK